MNISKSKNDKINLILAIARGELTPVELKEMKNPMCILWNEDDLSDEENIYMLGGKKVTYEQFKKVCYVE
jgi:hypothetical protein